MVLGILLFFLSISNNIYNFGCLLWNIFIENRFYSAILLICHQNLSALHHLFLKSGKKSKMSSTDGCIIFRWIIGVGLDQKKNQNQKNWKKSVCVTSPFSKIRQKSKMSSTDGCAIFRWIIGACLDQKKSESNKLEKICLCYCGIILNWMCLF